MAELFSGWLVKQVLGAAASAVRSVVGEERNRSALDDSARRALRCAVARQQNDLGEEQLEVMESALAELLWSGGDSIPLADEPSSLWARLHAGVKTRFSVLEQTEADGNGTTQAQAMGLHPAVLAEDFVDAFYHELEAAVVRAGRGAISLKPLWDVLAEGRGESDREAMLDSVARVDRRVAAMQGAGDGKTHPAHTHELADELLRGPLRARGLNVVVEEAARLAADDPGAAADRLSYVTEDLADAGFSALADGMRRRTTQLLVAAGRPEAAAGLLEGMVWQSVEAGGRFIDHETLQGLRELADARDLGGTASFIRLIDLIDQWYGGVDEDLGQFVPPLRELVGVGHPSSDRLVLWVAETAVAFGQLGFLDGQLGEFLRQVVSRRSSDGPDDDLAVRARLSLADATGETKDLVRHARRGELAPRLATLVFARLGRHHAWHGQPDEADDAYREAIKQACTAQLPREAGQAVRSLARVQGVYAASLSEEWFQSPGLAARVEATGTGSFFERRRDPLDAGLVALANQRLPDAVRHLRTGLRDHVTTGHLEAELNCHTSLTRAFSEVDPMVAVAHAIAGGKVDELKGLLPRDRYLDVGDHLQASAPWQRAAALCAVSLQGDLVPDIDLERLVDLALASTEFTGQGVLGPHVSLNAWKAIAAVAGRLTPLQAKLALAGLRPYVERDPGKYHYHDDEHVRIVCAIHDAQPGLRTQAREHLLALLEQGEHVAATSARRAAAGLKEEVDAVAPHLERLADAGNRASLDLLLDLGLSHPRLVSEAAAAAKRVLSRPPEPPGHFSFGSDVPHSAYLARVLDETPRVEFARHLLTLAEDRHRPEANRSEAIAALLNLARALPAAVRDEFFTRCMAIVEDPGPPHKLDQWLRGGLHPLSTVHVNLWFGSLIPNALVTASVLAQRADQWDCIVATAAPLLVGTSEPGVAGAAEALWRVPHQHVTVDLKMLARFSNPVVRQLGAVLWAHRPEEAPELGRTLARDTDFPVRAALASQLPVLTKADVGAAREVADVLREDPSWSLRQLVKELEF